MDALAQRYGQRPSEILAWGPADLKPALVAMAVDSARAEQAEAEGAIRRNR